jgi:nucleoside-diphosphate-sugar epimerase
MFHETILVTGAAGGVGSTAHTAIATLRAQGHRVRAMVRKLDARARATATRSRTRRSSRR